MSSIPIEPGWRERTTVIVPGQDPEFWDTWWTRFVDLCDVGEVDHELIPLSFDYPNSHPMTDARAQEVLCNLGKVLHWSVDDGGEPPVRLATFAPCEACEAVGEVRQRDPACRCKIPSAECTELVACVECDGVGGYIEK